MSILIIVLPYDVLDVGPARGFLGEAEKTTLCVVLALHRGPIILLLFPWISFIILDYTHARRVVVSDKLVVSDKIHTIAKFINDRRRAQIEIVTI